MDRGAKSGLVAKGHSASGCGMPRYVVFDNTAGPAGVRNALQLQKLVGEAKVA